MEVSEQGSVTVGSNHAQKAGGHFSRSSLQDGCRLEVDHTHYDSMLTFDLEDGRQWRKRIYPRLGYPDKLLRWGTVEEILSFLISFDCHISWISQSVPQRAPSGTVLFYDRSKTKKYREDSYDWKKRKSLSTIVREDRMRLKVGGYQLLYGCYAHSSSNPNLHRRTYWLIHNPNVIMVHYLEVVSSNYTHVRPASEQGSLEPVNTPSDWSMVTISDCNLCALLEMVKADKADMSSESLFTQLSLILNNNLEQAASLEEALISNNAGLPVDMYQDTRTKKTNNHKIDLARKALCSQLTTKDESVTQKRSVDSLYKAPHLVLCQSQNGAMSYFVTIPPPTRSSDASMFPPGTKLPLPSLSQSSQLSLPSPQNSAKVEKKRGRKGKEKAQESFNDSRVLGVLSQIFSSVRQSTPAESAQQPQNSRKDDYDHEKFSEFAHHLSDFDQSITQGLRSRSLSSSSADCEDSTADMNTSVNSDGAAAVCLDETEPCYPNDSASIVQNLASIPSFQPYSPQPMSHLPTGHSHAAHSAPKDNSLFGLDLDTESVQQLLQLSPGVSVDETTRIDDQVMDTSHPSSPFTQLIDSLTSPAQTDKHGEPNSSKTSTVTTNSTISHHSIEALPIWNESSQQNVPNFSSSANLSLGYSLNPLASSFQSQAQPSTLPTLGSFNVQNSTSQSQQEMLLQPQNHLPTMKYSHQGTLHSEFSSQLYSLPHTDGNLEMSSSLPFPGSLVPAQEYQDLESLMNTIITDGGNESRSQALLHNAHGFIPSEENTPVQTPIRVSQSSSEQISESLRALDTHSLHSLPFSSAPSNSSSSQNPGQASHHLSLPDLTLSEDALHTSTSGDIYPWTQFCSDHNQALTQSTSARSSACLSSGGLQDIPEGLQMEIPSALHQLDVYDYRTEGLSIPSSPGQASVSSRSSISVHDMFDSRSPSVLELCEMLSESPNVQQNDFSQLTLSDSEQQQLFRAAKTIQNAFRQYKDRRRARSQQKRAALMIEKYYKQYREAKEQQDHAARKIQQQYRDYRRSRDLNRAVLFVQQMYRYHRTKKSNYLPTSTSNN